MKRICALAAMLLGFLATTSFAAEAELTYVDLVKRLTDLERLAALPEPGETCAQWSSWDRKSKYDPAADKYIAWDANGDGQGFIRREGEQIVMAEMQGPGCIWRIWSAMPQQGHVKIHLDGADQPTIDLPFIGYFDHRNPPFTGKAIVHTVARGWNNYVPIPYQKSCKIVADRGWGNYYHFTYATYPAGTKLPTFKLPMSPDDQAALDAADKILSNCGVDPAGQRAGQELNKVQSTLDRAGERVIVKIDGARAITGIRVKLEPMPAADDRDTLRELCMKITFDDDKQPAVWAPLGDFFGTAGGPNKYRSLPLGLTDDGWFYCYWYMPFEKNASVEIINDGNTKRGVLCEVTHAPPAKPIEQLARFHAKWHRDAFLPTTADRKIDWTMLTTEGTGRFCGVMLNIWNPRGGWWGEGDEKFFVDSEKFPSTFGTGSEDYFGYAWGDPTLFQNAYHSQPISQGNKGHVVVSRWHITDNVPFQKSFEGDIEKYFANSRPTLYASTVYWYLKPGGKDPYQPQPLDQRVGYWLKGEPSSVKGAIEGEKMKILNKTGGQTQVQELDGGWSGDAHLWWTKAKVGDKLELALPVANAGKYSLSAHFTQARDYAIIQVYLDGLKLGGPVDLYNPDVRPGEPIRANLVEMAAGEHKLTIEIVGANEKAIKSYMVGLDYLKLEPAKN